MGETWVWFLGWEDPLEKGTATTLVFWPGELHEQRSLAGYNPWSHKQSDTTEWFSYIRTWAYTTDKVLMVVQQSQQTFKMGCDGDLLDCFPLGVLYSDPLICVLKNQTLPLKDETEQKGGRRRPSPFQPTKYSFAIQPLLPFQMQMDEVQQLFTENHLRHFPLRKNPLFHFLALDLGINQRSRNTESCLLVQPLALANKKHPFPCTLSERTSHHAIAHNIKKEPFSYQAH